MRLPGQFQTFSAFEPKKNTDKEKATNKTKLSKH